ncbi:MAG: hypothetical protein GY862_00200 [Gammaproteobacteria bacterium]|nr:hypothetical protein [Gammaproteobacteria bacterium]
MGKGGEAGDDLEGLKGLGMGAREIVVELAREIKRIEKGLCSRDEVLKIFKGAGIGVTSGTIKKIVSRGKPGTRLNYLKAWQVLEKLRRV